MGLCNVCGIIFIIYVVTSSIFAQYPGHGHGPLYGDYEKFRHFHTNNFHDMDGSPQALIVQFYSSWCGHCQRFAPTWRSFVERIQSWSHTVLPGGVDCGLRENLDTCKMFQVTKTPTILLFRPGNGQFSPGGYVYITVKYTEFNLMVTIFDYLKSLQERRKMESDKINLLTSVSVDDALQPPTTEAEYIVLLETNQDIPAGLTILDLGEFPDIAARLVIPEYVEFPQILIYHKDFKRPWKVVQFSNEESAEKITTKVKYAIDSPVIKDVLTTTISYDKDGSVTDAANVSDLEASDDVYMVDLENALRFVFYHEIAIHAKFTLNSSAALQDFLTVLVRYFPGRKPVSNFLSNLSEAVHREKYSRADYESDLADFESSYDYKMPEYRPYIRCAGSEPKYRGYPCALWTLFHTLTVHSYLSENETDYDPLRVLRAIRSYMNVFFSCGECAENFVEMYDEDAETSVKERGDEVFWLWRGHNKVNERLHEDITEDPQHPKVFFPTGPNCPDCWLDDGTVNETAVFLHLVKIYSNIIQEEDSRSVFATYTYDHFQRYFTFYVTFMFCICALGVLKMRGKATKYVLKIYDGMRA